MRDMLADAKSALGATYQGYKGGEYRMDEHSEVHISEYGKSYDLLPEYGIRWMLGP